jgi:surface antigen
MTRFTHAPARFAALLVAALLFVPPPVSFADPPPWAPAHGWRKKHDPYYVGYTGKRWEDDYGVYEGRCNREAVGAVIGGVVGGVIGSEIGKREDRAVATVLGAVIGAVIGARIGRDMDEADRACIGHSLEITADNRAVSWINSDTGVSYRVTPVRGFKMNGRACREFTTRITAERRTETVPGKACRRDDGSWAMIKRL